MAADAGFVCCGTALLCLDDLISAKRVSIRQATRKVTQRKRGEQEEEVYVRTQCNGSSSRQAT